MALSKITNASVADTAVHGRRNLIINGAMQVSQRGTSVTGITSGETYHTLDRVKYALNSLGTWTHEQSTNAPSGFSNSYKATCTAGNASPTASAYKIVFMMLEAQSLQHLGFGTSDAKSLTLSFWVKSNKTGSASVNLQQKDSNPADKQVTQSYTINSADTWEYKTVSFPADTSGVINNDNAAGFQLEWWLNSGSTYTSGSHQTTWTANSAGDRNSSNLGVGGANNDYWQITGIQLEIGDTATPFEHRSYGEELALCQRYYQPFKSYAEYSVGTTGNIGNTPTAFTVPMRAAPTFTVVNSAGSNSSLNSMTSTGSTATGYYQYYMNFNITSSGYMYISRDGKADAEL